MRTACRAATPFGTLTAIYENDIIKRVILPNETMGVDTAAIDDTLPFSVQIFEYFEGRRKNFSLPFLIPGTHFMQDVYRAVLDIPFGETATYAGVALLAGYPRAMRAVGNAMASNPLPILIPCHRVIHQSKSRCAYRGGIDMKHDLLRFESSHS